jgi:cytochrome c peroxidase
MKVANNRFKFWMLTAVMSLVFAACKPEQTHYTPTPYEFPQHAFFPSLTNIPADNPMTEEGVALGRKLFYDPRLSGRDGTEGIRSCSSCHHQEHNFEYGVPTNTHHAMLPLVNLAWNTTGLGWNGSVATLENMVLAAVTSPVEIDADTNQVVRYLQSTDDYPPLFEKAFGSREITFIKIERAIAQFVRSLVSADSKFDRYLRGETQLSQDELNGYLLFVTEDGADCFHCHGGSGNALMTTHLYYNNGLDDHFNDPQDRHAVTGKPSDRGVYKAPTLRNIAVSAPYMHDGRFTTLDQVIDFYSNGVKNSATISPLMHHVMQGGVRLTDEEKSQLKAFLNTLTDETFLNNPTYSNPNH